ncbi:hypothetical protein [Sphingobium sp. LMC3-1-1.1]
MIAAPASCKCGKPFDPKRVPKTGMCRNCWSIKNLKRKARSR